MDTGNYMAGQMDDLISNDINQYEAFIQDLDNRIEVFIKEHGYTWSVDDIVTEYRDKYSKGFYVSFTCRKVIEHFKDDLKKSTGI